MSVLCEEIDNYHSNADTSFLIKEEVFASVLWISLISSAMLICASFWTTFTIYCRKSKDERPSFVVKQLWFLNGYCAFCVVYWAILER